MEQKLSETDRKLFYVKLPFLLLLSSFSPFLLAPLYLCITGITTIDEFITILLSPYTILAYVIAVLCPFAFYRFLRKNIETYDGTDEVIRKNKSSIEIFRQNNFCNKFSFRNCNTFSCLLCDSFKRHAVCSI